MPCTVALNARLRIQHDCEARFLSFAKRLCKHTVLFLILRVVRYLFGALNLDLAPPLVGELGSSTLSCGTYIWRRSEEIGSNFSAGREIWIAARRFETYVK